MSIDKFKSAATQMAKESFNEVGNHLHTYITEEKREYPNVTIRNKGVGVTGKVAGGLRDVVDNGELRDSFKISDESSGEKVKIIAEWTADHASLVYSGTDKIPPYPWVQIGLREIDWKQLFLAKWEKLE
jgi:hypothetical protein